MRQGNALDTGDARGGAMGVARRGGRFFVHVAIVIGLLGAVLVRPATAQTGDASQVLSLVNSTRASVGLGAVSVDGSLSAVAQAWAGVMAGAGTIMHNPGLGGAVSGWTALAENVGMGSTIALVHQLLVNSPPHYANMTDSRYTVAGAGVVAAGGNVFVVEVFMQGQSAPPPPPPAAAAAQAEPEPTPTAAAPPVARAPVPEPEPQPEPEPEAEPAAPAPLAYLAPGPAAPLLVWEVPILPVEASPWMALVMERLASLDRTFGPRG